jgi:arabinofuranosyltransferase
MQLKLLDKFSTKQIIILVLILVLASIGLYFGWRLFWFLTDDAYIVFRYVSNSVLGYGYTWNLPPFRPVEGYTSFLWVGLLDLVWRISGIAPPESSNVISLLFAYGTTFLGVLMLLKMLLRKQLRKIRLLLLALILLGVLTNRTYLTWTSSGLETAMFNFFFTAWVFSGLFIQLKTTRWMGGMALTAVLTALTRPDGLLLIAATLFLIFITLFDKGKQGRFSLRYLTPLASFLVTVGHFLWRRHTYGEWLPNTHAAKYVAPWPASGLRYMLSFIIEYTLWFWIGLAIVFLFTNLYDLLKHSPLKHFKIWLVSPKPTRFLVALTITGTLAAHFVYYTFVIGGDHFEFRVYSHLILFIFLSSVWLLNALKATGRFATTFLILFILFALPIQWTHWNATRHLQSREETFTMQVSITSRFPTVIRPYVRWFDNLQFWLIERSVCARHQEHKVFHKYQTQRYPSRSKGILLSSATHPVMALGTVGVPGWMLPTVNIIDTNGLNDRVVARNPIPSGHTREMAHDRYPPAGYVECFKPNVKFVAGNKLVVAERQLTNEDIVACENRKWPPSVGEKRGEKINLRIETPTVNEYLWEIWPTNPVYLNYALPKKDNEQDLTRLLRSFKDYVGPGCIVIPPEKPQTNEFDYSFTFLPAKERPPLSDLKDIFPWTQIVTERHSDQIPAYTLGYAAPWESQIALVPDIPRRAIWTDQIRLIGYDIPNTVYRPGETIHLTLYHQATDLMEEHYSLFVHLLGKDLNPETGNRLWGQDDGVPCQGVFPPAKWQPDSLVVSKWRVTIPSVAPQGEYKFSTGLYDWQTRERLATEERGKQEVSLTQIQIDAP